MVPLIGWDLPPFLTVDIVTLYPCEILNLQQITQRLRVHVYKFWFVVRLNNNDRWKSIYSLQKCCALKTKDSIYYNFEHDVSVKIINEDFKWSVSFESFLK